MTNGRIEIKKRMALTLEQICAYDEQKIYDTLGGPIAFDDFDECFMPLKH